MTVRVERAITSVSYGLEGARAGVAPCAAVGGTSTGQCFKNDGRTFLRIQNTNGSSRTCIIRARGSTAAEADVAGPGDLTITCAGSAFTMAGPFAPGKYNQNAGDNGDTPAVSLKGRCKLDFESGDESDMVVEVYRLP